MPVAEDWPWLCELPSVGVGCASLEPAEEVGCHSPLLPSVDEGAAAEEEGCHWPSSYEAVEEGAGAASDEAAPEEAGAPPSVLDGEGAAADDWGWLPPLPGPAAQLP